MTLRARRIWGMVRAGGEGVRAGAKGRRGEG